MKRIVIVLVMAVLVVAGCGGGLKNKVVGTWKFDVASMKADGLTDEMKKSPEFTKAFDAVHLELKADGTYSGTNPDKTADTGKWTLDGKNLTVTPDKKDATKTPPTLTVNDDGTKIHAVDTSSGKKMEVDLVKA